MQTNYNQSEINTSKKDVNQITLQCSNCDKHHCKILFTPEQECKYNCTLICPYCNSNIFKTKIPYIFYISNLDSSIIDIDYSSEIILKAISKCS